MSRNTQLLRMRRRRSRRSAGNKAFTKKFRKFMAEALKPRRIIHVRQYLRSQHASCDAAERIR